MKIRSIHTYVSIVVVAAVLLAVMTDWSQFLALSWPSLGGFALLAVLAIFSEVSAFSHRIARESGTSSLVFLPLVACVLLFGPAAAVLFIASTAAIAEFLVRKKDVLRGVFNTAQYVLATAIGGFVFAWAGGEPFALQPAGAAFDLQGQALPAFAFGVPLFITNHLAVGAAISIAHHQKLLKVLPRTFGKSGIALVHDVAVLPVAIIVAYLYAEMGWFGLVVSIVPFGLIRYVYLSKYQLELANRDLLRALVKAIETRDPYTSGHSMRVQKFAETVGEKLGLGEGHLSDLSAAALLHDIGKIEVVYEEIIQKAGPLSDDEMKVIQSHVTRGVEILTSLSSVSPRIIRGVRHHHEKFDGSGYPDGLSGTDIPLEGRIIKTADAIDAMLSDRPYRDALSVEAVIEELERCAGGEFDPQLVELAKEHDLVQMHQELMRLEKALGPRDPMSEGVSEILISSSKGP
jgi:putative nucleotidyltransferase with HDIG domain